MARLSSYDYERLEDIMDDLREEGCPEDEVQETARMMLAESKGCREGISFLDEDNPFWEPTSGNLEAEFDEAGFLIEEEEPYYGPWYNPVPTRCTIA